MVGTRPPPPREGSKGARASDSLWSSNTAIGGSGMWLRSTILLTLFLFTSRLRLDWCSAGAAAPSVDVVDESKLYVYCCVSKGNHLSASPFCCCCCSFRLLLGDVGGRVLRKGIALAVDFLLGLLPTRFWLRRDGVVLGLPDRGLLSLPATEDGFASISIP